jgi:hypothetical protein
VRPDPLWCRDCGHQVEPDVRWTSFVRQPEPLLKV